MKSTWVLVSVWMVALSIGCSKEDGDVRGEENANESVPEEEALDDLCTALCESTVTCGVTDETLEECQVSCSSGPDEETSNGSETSECSPTRAQINACTQAVSERDCADYPDMATSLEDLLPEECMGICDDGNGEGNGDGGPPTDIDPESSLDYCRGYANPPCSDPTTCDGSFCGACSALVDACGANSGACDDKDDAAPVICELEWVDCIYAMDCGDPASSERAAACKEAFDVCAEK